MEALPKRRRSKLKWVFLVVSLVIAAGMVTTLFGIIYWNVGLGKLAYSGEIQSGCFVIWYHGASRETFIWNFSPTPTMWEWWPRYRISMKLVVPLWCPFLLSAVTTAWLFYRDRRRPPGHCQNCGYDMTANTTGRCPECGQVAPKTVQ